jgi:hypothetical protein
MVKATTIFKGEVIAEEEFELSPKRKGKQRKLSEYHTEPNKDD